MEVIRFLEAASKLPPSKRRRLLEAMREALAEQDLAPEAEEAPLYPKARDSD
jgi:hypothetical protein